jgi:hypothetical protein
MTRVILYGVLVAAAASAGPRTSLAQDAAPPPAAATSPAQWTDAQKEAFLLEAKVVKRRAAPSGITNSLRATLEKDGITHDAHIQTVDEQKAQITLSSGLELDFRDSWRNNVAAYRLDRVLGLRMVPVTVVRTHDQKPASFTWWVDDVLMTEKEHYEKKTKAPDVEAWNLQIFVVRVFDQLIYNMDRNLGNLLIGKTWLLWMIDHTRAFKIFKEIKTPKNLGTRCDRGLLVGLRKLDRPTLQPLMKGLLADSQIDALLARRDLIVRHFEEQIAARGEDAVLYDRPPRE